MSKLTLTEHNVLAYVQENPGTVEYRTDYDGSHYWYRYDPATKIRARAFDSLRAKGLIVLRQKEITTHLMREPRRAWVAYPA